MIKSFDSILVLLAVASALVLAHLIFRMMLTRVLAVGGLALALLWWGVVLWFYRDGMGPDSVRTHGVDAVLAFLSFFWIPALIWLGVTALCFMVTRRKGRELT